MKESTRMLWNLFYLSIWKMVDIVVLRLTLSSMVYSKEFRIQVSGQSLYGLIVLNNPAMDWL